VNSEQNKNSPGRSWSLGISLLLHGFVLLGLGAVSWQWTAPEQSNLVVYIAASSMKTPQASGNGMTAMKKTGTEPSVLRWKETTQPELQKGRPEPAEQVQSKPWKKDFKPKEVKIASKEKARPAPAIAPEIRVAEPPDKIDEAVENPPLTIPIQTIPASLPTLEGREDYVLARNPQSSILNSQSAISMLAFAGAPPVLGMIIPEDHGPVHLDAQIISLPEPEYPVLSRKRGEEGRVVVEVTISAQGKVRRAQVVDSSSHTRLDLAALKAVEAATFSPATKYGTPMESMTKVAYRFELKK
jgi:protein TonB